MITFNFCFMMYNIILFMKYTQIRYFQRYLVQLIIMMINYTTLVELIINCKLIKIFFILIYLLYLTKKYNIIKIHLYQKQDF